MVRVERGTFETASRKSNGRKIGVGHMHRSKGEVVVSRIGAERPKDRGVICFGNAKNSRFLKTGSRNMADICVINFGTQLSIRLEILY